KTKQFSNEQVGMMIHSMAHITELETDNPDLNFEVVPVPPPADSTGTEAESVSTWGLGVAENSEHPDEAWSFIEYLLSPDVNGHLSEIGNGFPGNKSSEVDLDEASDQYKSAYQTYLDRELVDEFSGAPNATELQRSLVQQVQQQLDT